MATELTKTSINANQAAYIRGSATGAAAISHTLTVPAVTNRKVYHLLRATLKLSVAPTTSESLTVVIDSDLGAAYDATIYTIDPSVTSVTNLVLDLSDLDVYLYGGEVLTFAYTNTDTRTWGLTVLAQEV